MQRQHSCQMLLSTEIELERLASRLILVVKSHKKIESILAEKKGFQVKQQFKEETDGMLNQKFCRNQCEH